MKVEMADMLIGSPTDLKRIQTLQSLFREFQEGKSFTTRWSGCRAQVLATASHWAITPESYFRRQSTVSTANQWASSWYSTPSQPLLRQECKTIGRFQVAACSDWLALGGGCYSCEPDLLRESFFF